MRTEINEIENGHKQASIKPKTRFSEKTDKADKSLAKLIYVKIVMIQMNTLVEPSGHTNHESPSPECYIFPIKIASYLV